MIINITQQQSVSAQCISDSGVNMIEVTFHISNECDRRILDSGERWYQYNERFFFRSINNSVDILATNLGPEDNGTMIVCEKRDTSNMNFFIDGQCFGETAATIVVSMDPGAPTSPVSMSKFNVNSSHI